MPARDGTGPNGQGARSGRDLGNYRGPGGPGNGNGQRRGPGCGRGRGLGDRCKDTDPRRGDSWVKTRLGDLQAVVEKLTERLGKIEEVKNHG